MTRYYHRERRDWRYYLRHFLQRANAILAAAILLALLAPSVAQAAPNCPGGQVDGRGRCVFRLDRRTLCAWPVQFADGRGAAFAGSVR